MTASRAARGRAIWTRLKTRDRFWISLLVILVAIGLGAALLAPASPTQMHRGQELAPPSAQHLLGTDQFGRDLLSRLLYGMRLSIVTSAVGVCLGATLGTALGFGAGYWGGRLESLVMRVADTMFAFPTILVGIVTAAVLSPGLGSIMIALILINVPVYARLARSGVLQERNKEYVESSRALGASDVRIMIRHILPNTLPVLVVQGALAMAHAMIIEAGLSFLGVGVQPPAPSLGSLLGGAREFIYRAPWYSIFPGIALSLLVLSMNFTADVARTLLDRSDAER